MSRFEIVKKLSLGFIGKGWDKAYINFKSFTADEWRGVLTLDEMSDAQEQLQIIVKTLEDHFIDGKGYLEGEGLVDLTKDDMKDMALDLYAPLVSLVRGITSDPK